MKMLAGRSRSGTLAQQLEDFYAPQAALYDGFRDRLLHGRREMLSRMRLCPGQTIVELGGGTGQNLRFLGYPPEWFERIEVVDLCPSLLAVAGERYKNVENVKVIAADATSYQPDSQVDRVYFSYALTMIPEWEKAVDNALRMLKPGGLLGVVDFYVSAEHVNGGVQHSALTRTFWKKWFAHDGVNLTPEHMHYLDSVCHRLYLNESSGSIPYLPLLKAPYYYFVGQKPEVD